MGDFVLDFAAYNALLAGSNGYGGSCYGADDVFLGGGDPGFSLLTNVGRRHLQHVHNQQQLHQQQQQNRGPAPGSQAAAAAAGHLTHHRVSSRYRVNDRNSLARLEAEKTLQDRRKANIANFGAGWLKPPGVSKTLAQIREELREQEEQAEAERREELAQQLVQAEAAAAAEAEEGGNGPEWVEGEEGGREGEEGAMEATGEEVDLDAAEGEIDLDNEIPEADDFSFGNNDDGSDDPFASSDDDEDDEETEDDEGGAEDDDDDDDPGNDTDRPGQGDDTFNQGQPEQMAYTPQPPSSSRRRYHQSGEALLAPSISPFAGLSGTATSFATPVHAAATLSIEDRRERVRARAAERRETHQMRATEDRVRAMLNQPRLSGLGGLGGGMSGLYGDDDDLDEDDQAQMLQEDDLVRESSGRAGGRGVGVGAGAGANSNRRPNRPNRGSLGNGGAGDEERGNYHPSDGGEGVDDYDQAGADLEMDMDADLDEDVPEGSSPAAGAMDMDLSTYEDGAYEHTDTEAELSSSIYDGEPSGHAAPQPTRVGFPRERSGLDVDDGDDDYDDDVEFEFNGLPRRSMQGRPSYGRDSRAAPRASNGSMAGGSGSGGGSAGVRPGRGSLGRSDRNSLDISGLLSQDESSNLGSSPRQVRWRH